MPIGKTWFQHAFRVMSERAGLEDMVHLKGHTGRNTLGDRVANSTNGLVSAKAQKAATGMRPPPFFLRLVFASDSTNYRAGHKSDAGFAIYNRPSDNAKRIMAAAAHGGAPAAAAMAVMSSAAAASSSSDVPMPKKRKAAADMTGALRSPQRFMKNIMPMMMSMMPVMMGQVTEMAAGMPFTSTSAEDDEEDNIGPL